MGNPSTRAFLAVACALTTVLASHKGSAQTAPEEAPTVWSPAPRIGDSASIVDVVDAFDVGAAWSFRLTAGYLFEDHNATISRETGASTGSLGVPGVAQVGTYQEITHTLMANAELGIYHDLALTIGVPFILSNTRQITQSGAGSGGLADGWTAAGAPTQVYNYPSSGNPLQSPERSGIDQLRFGIVWAILNQQRDRTKPTWLVRFEYRPSIGAMMNACTQTDGGGVSCPAPSSVPTYPTDGSTNASAPATRPVSSSGPGISRGVNGLYFQTAVARRMGYIEPYAGLEILAEIPIRSSAYAYSDTPYGQLLSFPPIQGTLTAGTEIIPWENRETSQRAVIDLRLHATYVSEGLDYSPLYDALGSSNSLALNEPGCPSNARNADGTCQPGQSVYFNGLTAVASHAIIGGNLSISIQPARFLRFNLGAGFSFVTDHVITNTDACSQATTVPASNPEWAGGCVGGHAPDPTYRGVIDSPGNRFITTNETYFDLYASIAITPRF